MAIVKSCDAGCGATDKEYHELPHGWFHVKLSRNTQMAEALRWETVVVVEKELCADCGELFKDGVMETLEAVLK